MSNAKYREKRSRAFETAAIFAGFAGLVLAVVGPYARDNWVHGTTSRSAPAEVRGARLDAMGTEPPRSVISDSAFAMAAQHDGVARRENGTLRFDRIGPRGHLKVPMSVLGGFPYDPKPHPPGASELGVPAPSASIPDEIAALDGNLVALVGFMVPLDVDARGVKSFVLSQNRSYCCYGIKPALNEMVVVQMEEGGRAPFSKDTPLAVFGRLAVSEQREGGHVLSLYRMEATEITTLLAYAQAVAG
ncbi:MAG: DUF3299 domain-containing protein [Nannocystaceae bacterium]|nr:DUF3299 domain-containing protein [bacterium]